MKQKSVISVIIQTKQTPVYSKEKVESVVNNLIDQLDELYETFKHKSSGWALKKIHYVYLESYKNKPIRGSSWIPTPDKYNNSRLSVFKLWLRNCAVLDQCALMNFYINFPNYILITYDAWDRGSFDKIALYGNDI